MFIRYTVGAIVMVLGIAFGSAMYAVLGANVPFFNENVSNKPEMTPEQLWIEDDEPETPEETVEE